MPTDAEIEAAAEAIFDLHINDYDGCSCKTADFAKCKSCADDARRCARAALEAAERVRNAAGAAAPTK